MFSSNVEDVITIQKKKSDREQQLKDKLLLQTQDRIQTYANFGKTECLYKIPSFVIGSIPYDLSVVNKYIYKKLKSEGYYIIRLTDEYIYISWSIKDLGKKEKKSNINFSAFQNNSKAT